MENLDPCQWEKLLEELPQSPGICLEDLPPLSPGIFDSIPWDDDSGFAFVEDADHHHHGRDPDGLSTVEFFDAAHDHDQAMLSVENNNNNVASIDAFPYASSSKDEDHGFNNSNEMIMDAECLLALSPVASATHVDSDFYLAEYYGEDLDCFGVGNFVN